MKDNGTAKTLKTVGMIVIVICVIGGVILGVQTAEGYSSFNLGVALIAWVSGFISGVLIFAFGEVVDLLQLNVDRQAEILEKLDKKPRQESGSVAYSEPKATSTISAAVDDNKIESGGDNDGIDRIMQLFDSK